MMKKILAPAAPFFGIAALITAAFVCALGACSNPSGGGGSVQYTITFDSHGGSEVAAITAEEGTELEQPADPTRTGYVFAGWFDAETGGALCSWPHILNADITMHARWQDNSQPPAAQHTLTFDSHGGSAVEAITADEGTAVGKPADPTRTGYAFAGWFDAEGAPCSWPHTLNADITMHARWQDNSQPPAAQHTLTFDSHGGSAVAAITADKGTAVGKPADPTRTGYVFAGWFDAETGGALCSWPHTLNADITMHARWTAIAYTVAYDKNADGASGTTASSAHAYDQAAALTVNGFAWTGYVFAGWNTRADGSGAGHDDGASVTNLASVQGATVTLYAQWTPKLSVTIDIWANEDGDILVSTNEITIFKTTDEPHSFTAEVKAPHAGAQWFMDGLPISGSKGANSITITADDYEIGSYILGASVTRDGVPWSTQILFTIAN
jgi:uncharacterized repeat protein (TIGR02543 family)